MVTIQTSTPNSNGNSRGGSLSSYLFRVRAKLILGKSDEKNGGGDPPPRENPNLGVTCGNDLSASRPRVKKNSRFFHRLEEGLETSKTYFVPNNFFFHVGPQFTKK